MLPGEPEKLPGDAAVLGEPSDHRTVDLQLGDGQGQHARLRLLDGPHVVDRDADPDRADAGERFGGLGGHRPRFGELEGEQRGRHPGGLEMVGHPFREPRLGQLSGCHVHRHFDPATGPHERRAVPARRLEHDVADGDHRAGRLGERDELAGRDEPALRVPPATQRLDGDEEPVAQVDLRLVPRDDLAPLGGEAQFSRQALLLRHAIPLPGVQGARPIVTCDHRCGETADSGPIGCVYCPGTLLRATDESMRSR